jgi:hypothetical protein
MNQGPRNDHSGTHIISYKPLDQMAKQFIFSSFHFLKVESESKNLLLSFFHATTLTMALINKFSSSQVEVPYLRFTLASVFHDPSKLNSYSSSS